MSSRVPASRASANRDFFIIITASRREQPAKNEIHGPLEHLLRTEPEMFQGGGLEQTLHRLQKKFGGKSWIHIETDHALALAFGQKSSKDWRDVSPTERGGQIVKILGNQ